MHYTKQFLIVLLVICWSCDNIKLEQTTQLTIAIPTTGNSWVINDVQQSSEVISEDGITNWFDDDQIIRTFFYVDKPALIPFGIKAKGNSEIKITYNAKNQNIKLSSDTLQDIYIGDYNAETKGYHYIDIKGITKDNATFGEISHLLLSNTIDSTSIKFVRDDFYFGRRGPSTHLNFQTPEDIDDLEWFYSEIEIDKNQDVIGCYFVANGFGEGYFGIQVNSDTERRVLFSIWSPFKTDDPSSIPEDQKIKLLKKGKGVTTGEFGNEGSGGQSYKVFNWKSETRYKFLTRIKPSINNSTNYTSYFFDPESNLWHLIASFQRPKTTTYLTRPYSFLENFIPNTGALMRKGGFYNQWVRDSRGNWYEVTQAKFTADATARKDARLDYSGGVLSEGFYLKNCGFTDDHTSIDTMFNRIPLKQAPTINFDELE